MTLPSKIAAGASVGERLGEQIEQMILRRLQEDTLSLPPMPDVSMKCIDILKKPDYDMPKLVKVVETDPLLAARILRVGNSAGFAAASPVTSLQSAITRLGTNALRGVIIEATINKVFESRDRRIVEAAKGIWLHSVAVAILARDLAMVLGAGDPEDAYMAGLLHDVGKPVLALLMFEAEKQVTMRTAKPWVGAEQWVAAIQHTHRRVGVALAKKWQLPQRVVTAVESCAEYDSNDRLCPANLVRFCNAVAKQEGICVGEIDKEDVAALITAGRSLLGVEDDAVVRLATGLREKAAGRAK